MRFNAFLITNTHLPFRFEKIGNFFVSWHLRWTLGSGASCISIMIDLKSVKTGRWDHGRYINTARLLDFRVFVFRTIQQSQSILKHFDTVTMSSWVITGVSRGLGVSSYFCYIYKSVLLTSQCLVWVPPPTLWESWQHCLWPCPWQSSRWSQGCRWNRPEEYSHHSGRHHGSGGVGGKLMSNYWNSKSKLIVRLYRKQLSMFLRKPMARWIMS
jgi:hypothetical protein